MRSFALVLLACTGCDIVFGIGSFDPAKPVDATIDAPPPSGPCSAISMLADSFATDDLKVLWPVSVMPAGTITVHDNVADLAANPNGYVTLDTGRFFDLREGELALKITATTEPEVDDSIALTVSSGTGYYVSVTRNGGQLVFQTFTPTIGFNVITRRAYDPIGDAYLRLRHPDDRLFLETSADGVQYAPAGTIPDASALTFVRVQVQSYHNGAATQLHAYVADVNGGTPHGAACPIASLQDDFSAATLDSKWGRVLMAGNGVLAPTNGTLQFTGPVDNSYAQLLPSTFYDLRNSAFVIEVPRGFASTTNSDLGMSINTFVGDVVGFHQAGGLLSGKATHAGNMTSPFSPPYDPVSMRWWRISAGATAIKWETSPDGHTWQERGETDPIDGLDRVDPLISFSLFAGSPDTADIDNFDLPPP